jgi:signal transduction histidine kinase
MTAIGHGAPARDPAHSGAPGAPAAAAGQSVGLLVGGLVAAVGLLVAVTGGAPASGLRHAYFLPVILAATRYGAGPGVLTASAAGLLHAPFVLTEVERAGVTAEVAEAAVTFGLLLLVGALGGVLAGHATHPRRRYETLIAVQRVLADEVPLDLALGRLRAILVGRLGADALALVVREGSRLVVAGGESVAPGSVVACALTTGEPLFVPDAGGRGRPRRVVVVPLTAGGAVIGALALERTGEIDGRERAALERLGAHVGLALENARLASRQRRFGDELAEKVAEATQRLDETHRMKSTFLAIASHELRTPLTALQGFAELLSTRAFRPPEVRRLAGIIHLETERLTRIVSDLLDLSHLERGLAPSLRRSSVNVGDALRSVVELLARRSTHVIHLECADALPAVDADADALDRVLKNLISNAMKYSPAGTAVTVRARALGAGVEFSVEDQGPGIPAAALPRVFEPYYRAPGAAHAAVGSGLGLAVVKSLVDAHGGSIAIDSALACGTRVTFVLPSVP